MGDYLIPDQEKTLSEFRRILKDEIPTEMYNNTILLTKFLKARNFDIKKAEFMIKNNVRWRKEMQVDTILTDFKPPEVLKKYFSSQMIGYDSEGYPIHYVQLGNIDTRGLFKSMNKIYLAKASIQELEKNIQEQEFQSKKLGKPIKHSTCIYDVAHLSLATITHVEGVQFLLKYAMTAQDHYPDIARRLFIINVSSYFKSVWPVVHKCLAPELRKKISVHGQDGWKEELVKVIDADTLPAFLGGNRTDPDGNPMCLNTVTHLPGRVPEKYFLEKNVTDFSHKPGVKSIRIERKDQISESVQITVSESIINWEFLLENYDIGFGVLLERADGRAEELVPVHKIETEVESYRGMYRCKQQGKHMIVFDNSYSWFHFKEVYYRIWITSADVI